MGVLCNICDFYEFEIISKLKAKQNKTKQTGGSMMFKQIRKTKFHRGLSSFCSNLIFLAALRGTRDLSSPTRDRTHAGSTEC